MPEMGTNDSSPSVRRDAWSDKKEEETPRLTFRTLGDVLVETVRLLRDSANGLRALAAKPGIDQRKRLMMKTLADARMKAARTLEEYNDGASREIQKTWLQYAGVFEAPISIRSKLQNTTDAEEAFQLIRRLDDRLSEAFWALSRSYAPPLESCEKASALLAHLKRASSAIMNSSRDI